MLVTSLDQTTLLPIPLDLYFNNYWKWRLLAQVDSFQVDIQDPVRIICNVYPIQLVRNGGALISLVLRNTGQGYWITNGDGSFLPDSTFVILNIYQGTLDTASNSVTLTFITENNGVCASYQ